MWLPWETLLYRHALYLLEELWGTLLYGPSHSEKLRCTAHLREARPSQSEKGSVAYQRVGLGTSIVCQCSEFALKYARH